MNTAHVFAIAELDLTTPMVTEVWRAASELRLPAVETQCCRMVGELDAADALVVLEDSARLDLNDVCQSMLQVSHHIGYICSVDYYYGSLCTFPVSWCRRNSVVFSFSR